MAQAKADVELCCPALPLNSQWHIQTCESHKPALLCPAWAALQKLCPEHCVAQAKAEAELCCPTSQLALTYSNVWITRNLRCSALRGLLCLRLNARLTLLPWSLEPATWPLTCCRYPVTRATEKRASRYGEKLLIYWTRSAYSQQGGWSTSFETGRSATSSSLYKRHFTKSIKCSRADSRVSVWRFSKVAGTDSVPTFSALLMAW